MGDTKRIIMGLYTIIDEIGRHFNKFETAVKKNDIYLAEYYVGEIEGKFYNTLDKLSKKIRPSHEIHQLILQSKKDRNEIKKKSLSLN